MSVFDWLFRRGRKRESEPVVPPPPAETRVPDAPRPPEPTAPLRAKPNPIAAPAPTPSVVDPYNSEFLPITRDEIIEAAKTHGNLKATAFQFGRQSIIPPATDPRTQLIDRALVSHGLLSPEVLAEIHRVGEEMEQIRPTVENIGAAAGLVGDAAVRAYRQEKERRKAQKKAESAARKTQREADVKKRRETDIIFLGRGVSGRMRLRLSDEAKLAELSLPVMHTPADVANALGLSIKQLRWLAFHTEVATRTHYVKFQVPKRSGGMRTLAAPHKTLKTAQRWMLAQITAKFPVTSAAHGFVPGRGIVSNANPHINKVAVINLDLENFFPTIAFPRVRAVFERYGYSGSVATILALLCTECPRTTVTYAGTRYEAATGPRALPQGAPTSPSLSNQVARKLDKRLLGVAAKLGITYTRYADDLTFSGPEELVGKIGWLLAKVRHVAREEGFKVNEKKTRIMRRSAAQTVTGIVVNDKPSISREELRRLRAILHRAKTEGLDAQNRDGRPDFMAWIMGKIAFVNMVRPDVGAKLKAAFDSLPERKKKD
jgi:RNA-directed DNA polymerase